MNYIILDNLRILHKIVMYVDNNNFLADRIFEENKLPIKKLRVYENEEYDNVVIISKIKKKHINIFKKCMKKLQDYNLIIGNTDYMKNCKEIMEEVLK